MTTRARASSSAAVLTLAVSSAAVLTVMPALFLSTLFMNDAPDDAALVGPLALVALAVGLLAGTLSRVVLGVPLVRAVVGGVLVAAAAPLVAGPVLALLTVDGFGALPGNVLGVALLGGLAVVSFRAGRDLLED